ncbi:hypothetical protein ZIOFF_062199 [Zingiber officinale]|uniref:DDE Tnp4 domain-containing protein n=1 Tax=Zingiber officinale TaxID=94328 RepID=A0A8J5F1H1_ZINOF|nr:hypothetical protein ZIOFF_062199 [Zingiber officinale]
MISSANRSPPPPVLGLLHQPRRTGALDGTFIPVTPPKEEKQRYRTRKGGIATNVLGVYSPNIQFIYVLPGWEGFAHDDHVLCDAISRPTGLKVPQGI